MFFGIVFMLWFEILCEVLYWLTFYKLFVCFNKVIYLYIFVPVSMLTLSCPCIGMLFL